MQKVRLNEGGKLFPVGGNVAKAELLQLNCTQFPSLGIFVSKKVGNQKTKTTFIISVLKVVY